MLPAAVGSKMIHRQVVRDAEEPGGDRYLAPLEGPDSLEHLHERLVREIFGVVAVPHRHLQVAVDAVEVHQVELLEGLSVAVLGALDEPANRRRSVRFVWHEVGLPYALVPKPMCVSRDVRRT